MNAALCVAAENHGSRQLGAQAVAAADVHLSVPPIRTLPLLRGSRPHDSVRLPVRRGDRPSLFAAADPELAARCVGFANVSCVHMSPPLETRRYQTSFKNGPL